MAILSVVMAVTMTGWKAGDERQSAPGKRMALEAVGSYMTRRMETGRFMEGEARGGAVLEDQTSVYFYSGCEIRKISKESQEVSIIWKSDDTEDVSLNGSAVLAGDKIFFMESWWARGRVREILSVVNTDGTGYERIEERKHPNGFLYFSEGHLYVEDSALVQENGVYRSGNCIWEYGIYTDGTWEKLKTLTGHAGRVLPDAVRTGTAAYSNEDYILLRQEEGLYLTDRDTQENRFLAEDSGIVIGLDEAYVYLCRRDTDVDGGYSLAYEKLGIEDGEKSTLFIQDGFSDIYLIRNITGSYGMGQITGSYIYYVEESAGKLYLARRNLDAPSDREALGDAFFDSGFSEAGRVEKYSAENRSEVNPDWGYVSVELERLVVDEGFPGAAEINHFLEGVQENIILYEDQNFQTMEENLENYGEKLAASKEAGNFRMIYSYSSVLSPVFCHEDRFISFCQEDEDYCYGQLHGSLYRKGYTFDLLTGERLALGDVVGNSGEEINEIVTQYFAALINEHPEAFWEDAMDIVRERFGKESDFYLKEEGICFYLPPYDIAAFAGGFQEVTVPYEEFDMKIDLFPGP